MTRHIYMFYLHKMLESDGWTNVSNPSQKSKKYNQKEKQHEQCKEICEKTNNYLISLTNDSNGEESVYAIINLIQNAMNLIIENAVREQVIENANTDMLEKWNNPKYTKEQICNLPRSEIASLVDLEKVRKKLWGVRLYQRNNEFLMNEKVGFDFELFASRVKNAIETLDKIMGHTTCKQKMSRLERKSRTELLYQCGFPDINHNVYDDATLINIVVYKRTIKHCSDILGLQDLLRAHEEIPKQEPEKEPEPEPVKKPEPEQISYNKGEKVFYHWLQQKKERELQEAQLAQILKRHEEERRILAFRHAVELQPYSALREQKGEPECNVYLS